MLDMMLLLWIAELIYNVYNISLRESLFCAYVDLGKHVPFSVESIGHYQLVIAKDDTSYVHIL